jgi:uncharacterized membrane protein YbhN (UPF0104 family)
MLESPVLRIAFLLAALASAGIALSNRWGEVSDAAGRLDPAAWALSIPLVFLGLLASMQSWRVVLADLGSPLPVGTAARIYFVGQLGKYVPGSVWPLVAQMEMARDAGVPRARSAVAFAVSVLIALEVAVLTGCAVLPLLPGETAGSLRWAVLLAPVMLVLLLPAVLNRIVRLALRVTRRDPMETELTLWGALRAACWVLLAWTSFGAQVWVVARSLGAADPGRALLLSVGGFALAWAAGFVIVIAPAGAGVRDVALVAALSPVLDRGSAIVAALVSRLLLTTGDVVTAGIAAARYRVYREHRAGSGMPTADGGEGAPGTGQSGASRRRVTRTTRDR